MIKIEDIGSQVKFDQPTHKYTLNGRELLSVTTVLNLYKQKFDPLGHIARACANRENISVESIKQRWEDKKNNAADRGTKFHKAMEDYIESDIIPDNQYKKLIKEYIKIRPECKIFSETVLFSEKYGMAGTADLIYLSNKNKIQVADWKTNEKFSIKPKYGGKLLYPLEHLGDSHLETYSLQLWIYSIMLEDFGYKIKDFPIIYWIDMENNKIIPYECLDLKKDALKLLNHYKQTQEF